MLNIEYKDEELKLFIETGKSNDKRYKKLKSNTSKYRLIFEEFENGIRICLIEISEHYGDK